MQTIPDIARHLSDIASKENIAVEVVMSEGGKRLTLQDERSDAAFHMELASDGAILIGYPPSSGGLQTQVITQLRRPLNAANAAAEAETWMRRVAAQ